MILYISHLGRIVQKYHELRPKVTHPAELLNTTPIGKTGQSVHFMGNLIDAAITCILINNNKYETCKTNSLG